MYLLIYMYIHIYMCVYTCIYRYLYICIFLYSRQSETLTQRIEALQAYVCSADGSTHTESNKLYRKVKHRYRPNLSPRQRPTAKARHDQAALAASAEARGATHRARPRRAIRAAKKKSPESRFLLAHFMNPCTWKS